MLNKELEQSVLGMRTGETREVALPDGTVDMTLVSVMNRVCPEPSNEMVEALGLDGIHTLEEYRVHLVKEQRRGKIQEAMYAPLRYLVRQVIDQSEFVLYQEDWLRAVEMRLEFSRALAKEEGFVLEEMTAKEFEGRIPVKTYDGLVALEQRDAWDRLCRHLLGAWYAERDGFTVSEEEYEVFLAEYQTQWHVSEEAARKINTYESYVFNQYEGHAYDVLQAFVIEHF